MTKNEIIEKAKKKFYYCDISPYYYGLKTITKEIVKQMTIEDFLKRFDKIEKKYNKYGDLVRVDNITVKCFYNNSEVLLIILK